MSKSCLPLIPWHHCFNHFLLTSLTNHVYFKFNIHNYWTPYTATRSLYWSNFLISCITNRHEVPCTLSHTHTHKHPHTHQSRSVLQHTYAVGTTKPITSTHHNTIPSGTVYTKYTHCLAILRTLPGEMTMHLSIVQANFFPLVVYVRIACYYFVVNLPMPCVPAGSSLYTLYSFYASPDGESVPLWWCLAISEKTMRKIGNRCMDYVYVAAFNSIPYIQTCQPLEIQTCILKPTNLYFSIETCIF